MGNMILKFTLCGISAKKSFLRGTEKKYPIFTINLLFLKIIILGNDAAWLHMQSMFGLAKSDKWLIENYHSVKQYCEESRRNAFAEARIMYEGDVDFWRKRATAAEEQASEAKTENRHLRATIKIISGED